MKRKITTAIIVLILGMGLSFWYIADSKTPTKSERNAATIDNYEEKLGILLPVPGRIESLWSSRGWFGDGQSITILNYTNINPPMEEREMSLITEVNLDFANSIIRTFIEDTLSMQNDSTKVSNVFEQHNVEVSIDDFYYYKKDSKGYNYFIVVFKSNEKNAYVLEWYQ